MTRFQRVSVRIRIVGYEIPREKKAVESTKFGFESRRTCSVVNSTRQSAIATGRVAKQADAQDLKSCGTKIPCGFEPRLGY